MKPSITGEQLGTLERLVKEITVQGLTAEAKEWVRRLLLAGHSPSAIASLAEHNGATRVLVNGMRWYAEEEEGNLIFSLAEGQR